VADRLGTGLNEAVPLGDVMGVPDADPASVGGTEGGTVGVADGSVGWSVGVPLGRPGSVGSGDALGGGMLPDGLDEGLVDGSTGSVGEGLGGADGSGLGVGSGEAEGTTGSGDEESPIPTPDTAPEVSSDSPALSDPARPSALLASSGLRVSAALEPVES
jgi:hypothetical protein